MKLSQSKCHGFTFYRSSENNGNGNGDVKLHVDWGVRVCVIFWATECIQKVYNARAESDRFFIVFIRAPVVDRGEKQQSVSIDDDNNRTMYTANECTRKLTAT